MMIVSENGNVTNQILRLKAEPDEDSLRLLSKAMTYSYQGKTINNALKTDIIEDIIHDANILQEYTRDIKPRFMRVLENILNVNMYMEGLANIFNLPEYNDVSRARTFMELIEKKDDFARKTNVLPFLRSPTLAVLESLVMLENYDPHDDEPEGIN